MPKLNEFLFGTKDKIKKASTMTPEQEQLMKLISEGLTSGSGPLADLFGDFNEQDFQKGVSDPALEEFKKKTLPMLQEKFIAGNQTLGSGMQNAQAGAASDLQAQLAKLLYEAKQGHKQNKLSGMQTLMNTKGFENIYKKGSKGAVQGFVEGVGEGVGKAAGAAIAG